MKTFAEFLNEMALSSYRHKFGPDTGREEGFSTLTSGKPDIGYQISGVGEQISGRFSRKDRQVITHPRTARILEERLKESEFDFNILLIEDKWRGEKSPRDGNQGYESQVEEFMEQNGMRTEGHITFVKNGTSGHVLTPWMILHTMGHALAEEEPMAHNWIRQIIHAILERISPGNNDFRTAARKGTFARLFMFKSASIDDYHNSGNTPSELCNELIAEFLWNNGTIRIKPPYDEDQEVMSRVESMKMEIRSMLQRCVGKIIYDYFN